jgi:hypothetical protein
VSLLPAALGVVMILTVLWDGFETMVLPRRVTRRFRLARFYYRVSWRAWLFLVCSVARGKRQETLRSFYAPLSLMLLLSIWAFGLIVGFACLYWACGTALKAPEATASFGTALYLSGSTFFTLGIGDVTPLTQPARILAVVEAGMGFAFLAILIGHLPVLNQSFSRREVNISLLDARAGSPPTALEILRRHCSHNGVEPLQEFLHDWERWSAELLESHLSYPVLAYYRSQHDNQSWLAGLTAILDACALVVAGLEGSCPQQARLTFAMARHALVDLSLVFNAPPRAPERDRMTAEELSYLRATLAEAGLRLRDDAEADRELKELRRMYEPYVTALSTYLHLSVPPWIPGDGHEDNWKTSAWESDPSDGGKPPAKKIRDRHF